MCYSGVSVCVSVKMRMEELISPATVRATLLISGTMGVRDHSAFGRVDTKGLEMTHEGGSQDLTLKSLS